MKLLHISDLHLGRRLYNHTFLPQQEVILQQILDCVTQNAVSVLLIAGDIYDKPVPPTEAVTLFDRFLTQLSELQVSVFFISGNHDSPERLQFGGTLLQSNRVHIAGTFSGSLQTVTLEDEYGKLHISMLPYLKPAAIAAAFPEESFSDLSEGIRHVLQQTPPAPQERSLLMYHGFVLQGGNAPESSDSEQELGGMQLVDADVFSDFDYVALGHIHKPQWVKKERIRYSGSLMKYSFSESQQKKSVTLLDWKEKGNLTITDIPLSFTPDMRTLRGTLEALIAHAEPSTDWIRAELTDSEVQPYALEKLRASYPNLLELEYLFQQERLTASATEAEAVPEQSLMELLESFYQNVFSYDLQEDPAVYEMMQALCKEAEEDI